MPRLQNVRALCARLYPKLVLAPAFLLAIGPANVVYAQNFFVDAVNGSPGGDGSPASPWQTITQAMTSGSLASGDFVFVRAGTYDAALGEAFPISLVSGITLTGPVGGGGIVRHDDAVGLVLDQLVDGTTTVANLDFQNGGGAFVANTAIRMSFTGAGGDVRILRNTIDVPLLPGRGIRAEGLPENLVIGGNVITSGGIGRDFCELNELAAAGRSILVTDNDFTGRGELELNFEGAATAISVDLLGNDLMDGAEIDVEARDTAVIEGVEIRDNLIALGDGGSFVGRVDFDLFDAAQVLAPMLTDNDLDDGADINVGARGTAQLIDALISGNSLAGGAALGGGNVRLDVSESAIATNARVEDNVLTGGSFVTLGPPPGAGSILVSAQDGSTLDGFISNNMILGPDREGIRVELGETGAATQLASIVAEGNTITGANRVGVDIVCLQTAASADGDWAVTLRENSATGGLESGVGLFVDQSGGASSGSLDLVLQQNSLRNNVLSGAQAEVVASARNASLSVTCQAVGNTFADNGGDGASLSVSGTAATDGVVGLGFDAFFNAFDDNDGAGVWLQAEDESTGHTVALVAALRANSIEANGDAGLLAEYVIDSAVTDGTFDIAMSHTTIAGNGGAGDVALARGTSMTTNGSTVVVGDPWSNVTVGAQQNFWGTTDLSVIESRVFHVVDDPAVGTVDFADPFPDTLTFTAVPDSVSTSGGERVTVSAGALTAFVPFIGVQPIDPGQNLAIVGTLDGQPLEDIVVSPSGLSLNFTTPGGLSTGPIELVITNPEGQSGTFSMNGTGGPLANDDTASVEQRKRVIVDVLQNDDPGDFAIDETTVEIQDPPLNGEASVDPVTGAISYISDPFFTGFDVVTYRVDDVNGTTSNEAKIMIEIEAGCVVEPFCTAKTTSLGTLPRIRGNGSPSLAKDDFRISLLGAVPGEFAVLLSSVAGPNNQPFLGGTLCIAEPVAVVAGHLISDAGVARVDIPIDGPMVGTERWYQWWFRDLANPDGTGAGLSDGLTVIFCD